MIRRLNYALHAWLGVTCAIFLLVASLSGAVLVVASELDAWWVHPAWHDGGGHGPALTLDALLASVREAFPAHAISGITLAVEGKTHQIWLVQDGAYTQAFLHPVTGEVLGSRGTPWMTILVRLHYSLLLGDCGAALMFFPACGLVLLGTGGLWVHRACWRALTRWPRFHQAARLGWSDLHKALGLPLYGFLVLLGSTGAFLNFGFLPTVFSGKARMPWDVQVTRKFEPVHASLDAAVAEARALLPRLRPYYLGFPRDGGGIFNVFGELPGWEIYGPYGCRVGFDAVTGQQRQLEDCRTLDAMGKAMALVTPLHFGNFGGGWVKALYCCASLGIALLTLAGMGVWRARKKSKASPKPRITAKAISAQPLEDTRPDSA